MSLMYLAISLISLACVMMMPILLENPPNWYLWAWFALKYIAIAAVVITGGMMVL